MKLRDWVLNWKNRPEDWVFEAQMTRSGRRANAKVVFGQEGLAILMRQPSATNAAALRYGFVAAPQHIGFYSGPEQSKLVGKAMGGQYETIVAMGGNPEHDNARGHVHVGGGWHNKSLGTPYSMRLDLAPVFFVALAHPLDGSCRLAQGILSVQSETNADIAFEMTAEATTGRLMAWHMSMQTNDVRLVLRCEEGAFARVLRRFHKRAGSEAPVEQFAGDAWEGSPRNAGKRLPRSIGLAGGRFGRSRERQGTVQRGGGTGGISLARTRGPAGFLLELAFRAGHRRGVSIRARRLGSQPDGGQ